MGEWQTAHKSAYLADFIELNKNLQQAVVRAVEELEQDPTTPRGNTIKKLQGYEDVWRYRLGDFRLIYAAKAEARMIQLLAIGPRGSVYQRFNYAGWDAPNAAVEFGPELAAQPEWMDHPEWFKPEEPEKEKLPRKLTPALLKRWRIDPQYHHALMRCQYADDLLDMSDSRVPAEVIGQVMDGLWPADVGRIASQPDLVLFDPEDLLRYAEGDLAGFLLRLDDQQEPLTRWALSGPTLVKGGPGSGKSTVALYRLRAIIDAARSESGRSPADPLPSILFTTYTNALINLSESLLGQMLRDVLPDGNTRSLPQTVQVSTLHKIARQIAGAGRFIRMAGEKQLEEALQAARYSMQPRAFGDAAKIQPASILARLRDDYLLDEFHWVIEGQDCRTEDDYQQADRTGRGLPFPAYVRSVVWQLYQHFREFLENQSHFTWGSLVQAALDRVRSGQEVPRWDYVIIDEAQDLPPAALALAVELCRDPAGLFLTADANQSLYNRGFRWRNVHGRLNVTGRTRILRRNYRSTRQIAQAAADILRPLPDFDEEAVQQEYVHTGRRPLLYGASGSEDQARWIGQQIFQAAKEMRLPVNAAAVLVSSSTVGRPLAQSLTDQGLPAKFMTSQQFALNEPCIKVTTLHAAKGLEFPIVVVAHVEAGRLPRETEATDPEEIAAFLEEQRRLFYVGCTRAMRYLFATYDRQLPSPFLADLSAGAWRHD
jgi:superfamily I DNA/RNA helicase/mRNA-degrading endonuclease RelE of RelBE toxin-antitoxin system